MLLYGQRQAIEVGVAPALKEPRGAPAALLLSSLRMLMCDYTDPSPRHSSPAVSSSRLAATVDQIGCSTLDTSCRRSWTQ